MRRTCAAVAAVLLGVIGLAGTASAHPATDFLKVPIGQLATVLLPPITTVDGPLQLTITSSDGFVLAAVDAGPAWSQRTQSHLAVLTGHGSVQPLIVSVTGTAKHAGLLPLTVTALTGGQALALPSDRGAEVAGSKNIQTYTLSALAGYIAPSSGDVAGSPPDPIVALSASHRVNRGSWSFAGLLVAAAIGVLAFGDRITRITRITRRPREA